MHEYAKDIDQEKGLCQALLLPSRLYELSDLQRMLQNLCLPRKQVLRTSVT